MGQWGSEDTRNTRIDESAGDAAEGSVQDRTRHPSSCLAGRSSAVECLSEPKRRFNSLPFRRADCAHQPLRPCLEEREKIFRASYRLFRIVAKRPSDNCQGLLLDCELERRSHPLGSGKFFGGEPCLLETAVYVVKVAMQEFHKGT